MSKQIGIYCPNCDIIHLDYVNIGDPNNLECNRCGCNPNNE